MKLIHHLQEKYTDRLGLTKVYARVHLQVICECGGMKLKKTLHSKSMNI